MKHRASRQFCAHYDVLPTDVRIIADKNFELLKSDPKHPSLHLKRIGLRWSVRVGERYRALGIDSPPDGVYWFWIGSHANYDKQI